jgi:hypothetical protein
MTRGLVIGAVWGSVVSALLIAAAVLVIDARQNGAVRTGPLPAEFAAPQGPEGAVMAQSPAPTTLPAPGYAGDPIVPRLAPDFPPFRPLAPLRGIGAAPPPDLTVEAPALALLQRPAGPGVLGLREHGPSGSAPPERGTEATAPPERETRPDLPQPTVPASLPGGVPPESRLAALPAPAPTQPLPVPPVPQQEIVARDVPGAGPAPIRAERPDAAPVADLPGAPAARLPPLDRPPLAMAADWPDAAAPTPAAAPRGVAAALQPIRIPRPDGPPTDARTTPVPTPPAPPPPGPSRLWTRGAADEIVVLVEGSDAGAGWSGGTVQPVETGSDAVVLRLADGAGAAELAALQRRLAEAPQTRAVLVGALADEASETALLALLKRTGQVLLAETGQGALLARARAEEVAAWPVHADLATVADPFATLGAARGHAARDGRVIVLSRDDTAQVIEAFLDSPSGAGLTPVRLGR